jgi:outer membrane protein assembly factor BamE (lipoprotein component of BamABCDE complex)
MESIKNVSLLLIIIVGLFTSCKTHTTLSRKVSLGMTKEQVWITCGKPYKTSAKYDREENLLEIYYYKEKTWDDGGASWSTTVTNHMLVFKNNVLVAIEQGNEEHNKQQYNTHFIW